MPTESTVFYGLRSNAHQLVTGAGVAAVRRRMKLDALLHDVVAVEAGQFVLWAGEGRQQELYMPDPPAPVNWQTPRQRHPRGRFHVRFRPDIAAESAPWHTAIDAPVQVRWSATFMPFFREADGAYDWLRLVLCEDDPATPALAREMARRDEGDRILIERWSDRTVREVIARTAALDLIRVSQPGIALSADPFHLALLRRRVQRGDARSVLGRRALELINPSDLSWDEINELRQMPGFNDYRSLVRDIESEALEVVDSDEGLELDMQRRYDAAIERARNHRPSVRTRIGVDTISLIVGEAVTFGASGVPVVGGIAGAAVGEGIAAALDRRAQPKWLAIDRRFRASGRSPN